MWAVTIGAAMICTLATATTGMGVYIFNGMAGRLETIEKATIELRQQVVVLQAQMDTQSKICRFPK